MQKLEQVKFVECLLAFGQKFCLLVCYLKMFRFEYTKTIILSVNLYGCETCQLTLREECRLRLSDKRVPRKLFRPGKEEVT